KFHTIFFGGFWLSFIIHEYLHVFFLKSMKPKGEIEIELTLIRMTLYPKFKLAPNEMIKVAVLPLIILSIIGLMLICLANWTSQSFLMIIGSLYLFHMINIIFLLFDGMMLLIVIILYKYSFVCSIKIRKLFVICVYN